MHVLQCVHIPTCTAQVERGLAAVTYLRKQVGLQHLPTVQQQQQDAPNSGGGGSKAGQKFMQGLLAKAQTQVLCMYATSLLSYCCCF
jgi:hypothetical protein